MIENLKCPDCGGAMTPRTNRAQGTKFWGCRAFPACRGTRDAEGHSKEEKRALRDLNDPDPDQDDDPLFHG